MKNNIEFSTQWDVSDGDYKPEELNYVKRHEMVKAAQKRERNSIFIAFGAVAVLVLLLIFNLAAQMKI